MGRKKNMTLRHVLKLGEPKSRLYRFDQWNDIFRYWSIPVYRFKFIIIFYIYKYIYIYIYICVCVCIIINIKVYHITLS